MRDARAGAATLLLLLAVQTRPTRAQESVSRFSLESALSADVFDGDNVSTRPNLIVDVTAQLRLGDHWVVYVRPWARLPRTTVWDWEIYQAAVRYERGGRVAVRVDAGRIASPIGLGLMDASPATNPTIMPHIAYFSPMLPFDTGGPRVNAIASTYPLGVVATASTDRWDARAAVVSTTPTRIDEVHLATNPPSTPTVEAGAGVTPIVGLRLGVSFARGAYLSRSELRQPPATDPDATIVGIEGEYAFRYTKVSGEWIRNRLDARGTTFDASTWFVQGQQTLSPRWFVAGRHEGVASPVAGSGTVFAANTVFKAVEGTAGFRLTPELTLRGSYYTRQPYGRSTWDQQVGAQIVWARRWW